MPEVVKRLGTTTATTATSIHDNGTTLSTYSVVSSIIVCNTAAISYTYNISTSTTTNTHGAYIASGATIGPNDTVVIVAGICLDPTNRYLVAHSSNAAVNITAYGVTGS